VKAAIAEVATIWPVGAVAGITAMIRIGAIPWVGVIAVGLDGVVRVAGVAIACVGGIGGIPYPQ
jgi:hypothetical protein